MGTGVALLLRRACIIQTQGKPSRKPVIGNSPQLHNAQDVAPTMKEYIPPPCYSGSVETSENLREDEI